MTKFTPPISERTTNELIEIIYLGEESWKKEAINQAKQELVKRRVSEQKQEKVIKQWEKETDNYIIQLKKTLEQNQYESYTKPKMLYIFLLAPLLLVGKWTIGKTIFELRDQNFKIKYKQRIALLICGTLFWTISVMYQVNKPIKLTEKEEIEHQEWRKEFGYDK